MTIAFTGTRSGMTSKQILAVAKLMRELRPEWALHGDCIGADSDFHNICNLLRGDRSNPGLPYLHIFPSNRENLRAYCEGAEKVDPPQEPLERNKEMIKLCDRLIATPKEMKEQIRSGTWTTRRYGIAAGKIIYTFLPDGSLI